VRGEWFPGKTVLKVGYILRLLLALIPDEAALFFDKGNSSAERKWAVRAF